MTTEQLADLAQIEAIKHPARVGTAACRYHLWASLTIPPAKTTDAARRAITTYGDEQTQADALTLLDRFEANGACRWPPA